MPKRCQAVIDAKGGWTSINGICRYRTSQLNKIFTIVLVALLFSEHSPFELIDFDGGPFHVADTVVHNSLPNRTHRAKTLCKSLHAYIQTG